MNNLDCIVIQNFEWVEDNILNFELLPTDELLDIADEIREKHGYTDISTNLDNNVWYNFYLDVDLIKQNVAIWFSCNNGEKDDYASYEIEISKEEKEQFMWKAFCEFIKEVERRIDYESKRN